MSHPFWRLVLAVTLAVNTIVSLTGCGSPRNVASSNDPAIKAAPPLDGGDIKPVSNSSSDDFFETKSGLKYKIVREGSGKKPRATDTVKVHYRGWLDSGKEFDSSYKRNEPIEFPLNGVIKGWTEGMQLIGEGGEIELEIPYYLGYGERGSPPDIPPRARLHFRVELLNVK